MAQDGTDSAANKCDNPCQDKGFDADRHRMTQSEVVGVTGFEPATSWSRTQRTNRRNVDRDKPLQQQIVFYSFHTVGSIPWDCSPLVQGWCIKG
jgi:hypothetical protein